VGQVTSQGWNISRWDHAFLPWIRLLLLDGAVRVAAFTLSHDLELPGSVGWEAVGQGQAFAHLVQYLRKRQGAYPRKKLASNAGISHSTLDEWLAGRQLPQSENIENVAHALVDHPDEQETALVGLQLRVAVAASEFFQLLHRHLGEEDSKHVSKALGTYVDFAASFISQSRLDEPLRTVRQWQVILGGTRDPGIVFLLRRAIASTKHQELQADLKVLATGDWSARILGWYRRGEYLDPPGTAKRIGAELGLSAPDAESLMEMTMRAVLLPPLLGLPDKAQEKPMVRLTGDTDFKQGNREEQWNLAIQAEQFDEAVIHASRLIELAPDNAKYHLWLGGSLNRLGKVDEALHECRIASVLDPDWCLPAVEIGIVLLDTGRNQEAVDHLYKVNDERAPRNAREAAHLTYHFGLALMRVERHEEAIVEFLALADQSGHARAMDLLAHCYFEQGNRPEGRQWAKKAAHRGEKTTLTSLEEGRYDK